MVFGMRSIRVFSQFSLDSYYEPLPDEPLPWFMIRTEYLTPYRAVKYDCIKLKGFFSYNSVIPCIFDTRYIIALYSRG